ncbi:MAG: redoxin domain-containing protein [Chloroflexi bacterium]|nr:redoxin domain-containing protein [Chloroflexota bacterium]
MSRRGWLLLGAMVPVLALFALLTWAVVQSGGNPGSLGVNQEFGQIRVSPQAAKDFSLTTLDGDTIDLASLRGKVVMVDFWASWCAPCRFEAPDLVEVYLEYADRDVEFVGVAIWDQRQGTIDHIERYQITYPNGVDEKGAIAISYGVRGIPEKFFISRDGMIVKKFVGPVDAETLRRTLNELLGLEDPVSAR